MTETTPLLQQARPEAIRQLLRCLVAVLALVSLLASPAWAQEPKRPPLDLAFPTLRLLTQKAVQDDLKMTPDQVKKLDAAFKKMRKLRDDAEDAGKKP